MKKNLKIRWLLLAILVAFLCHHAWHSAAPETEVTPPPEALPQPADLSSPLPSPVSEEEDLRSKPRSRTKRPRTKHHEALAPRPKPMIAGPESAAEPILMGLPVPSPQASLDSSVLDNVAFEKEPEVLASLGTPDETLPHEGRVSWYYSRTTLSRQGKPICPEIQFFDGQARVVIMWSPDKMKEMIATARRLKVEGNPTPKGPQTFTFLDSFKYLGVGTPQDTVEEDLGDPDSKSIVDGKEEWDYDTMIVENGSSRRLAVLFKGGKVVEVQGR